MKIYLFLTGTAKVCFTCTFVCIPNVFKCLNCLKSLASKVFWEKVGLPHIFVFISNSLGTSQKLYYGAMSC